MSTLKEAYLYPRATSTRQQVVLGGPWRFQFDPHSVGMDEGWHSKLPEPIEMPVPCAFSDVFTDAASRDYTGDFWYETDVCLPHEWENMVVLLRFGAAAHRARIFVNGQEVCSHEGGFLPFAASVNQAAVFGGENRISVLLNNELREDRIPVGLTERLPDGTKLARGYFDFFNYSGILRPVNLLALPEERILDYSVVHRLQGSDAWTDYRVETNGAHPVRLKLYDQDGREVATAQGSDGSLYIPQARLWKVRDAYLYRLVIQIVDGDRVLDEYTDHIGIRTVSIEAGQLLLNGEPVYLKGFGRHEESELYGRALSPAALKRDFELMKWCGANSFRTAHYPHSEETYLMADREGFLVIDETPAVGMMTSTLNFLDAAKGTRSGFFQKPGIPELLRTHLQAVEGLILRDKNRACVIAWCLLNEPETTDDASLPYLEAVFAAARALDPQQRPCTFTSLMTALPHACKCQHLCDIISLNRYYGWYVYGGKDLSQAREALRHELTEWSSIGASRPVLFTEYGADTHPGEMKLPDIMWTQEYQTRYLAMCHEVFDQFPIVKGEQLWTFADFQTDEGILRVNGNKKGLFTRQRQPKAAAHAVKLRWESLPTDHKSHTEGKTKEGKP